jgi:hypothetical protein
VKLRTASRIAFTCCTKQLKQLFASPHFGSALSEATTAAKYKDTVSLKKKTHLNQEENRIRGSVLLILEMDICLIMKMGHMSAFIVLID